MCKQNRTTQTQSGSKKQKGAIGTITGDKAQKAKRGRKEASDLPVALNRAPHERGPAITVLGLDVGAGGQQMAGHPPVTRARRKIWACTSNNGSCPKTKSEKSTKPNSSPSNITIKGNKETKKSSNMND